MFADPPGGGREETDRDYRVWFSTMQRTDLDRTPFVRYFFSVNAP
jgi:hypothetical protein